MSDNYGIKPNSHRSKATPGSTAVPTTPEKTKLEPVVGTGRARVGKKGFLSKLTGTMLPGDTANVKDYIVGDVLVPSVKKAILDIVVNGIDILLYGEAGHTKRRTGAGGVSYRNYDDVNKRRDSNYRDYRDTGSTNRNSSRSVSLFEDVVVDSRGEASEILSRMSEYLEQYPVISVADMYDLANIPNCPHTYHNYGWRSVIDAKIVPSNDGGWRLKMPTVEPLK